MMMDKLFLHICCAPCALYPITKFREEGISLTGFFYNPNIQPLKEFKRRKETLRQWTIKNEKIPIVWDDSYPLEEWLLRAIQLGAERCKICYFDRMMRAAEEAKTRNFSHFSTTLLTSTHQKHDWVREAGEKAAFQVGIKFYYEDWRLGWEWAEKTSKKQEMYRQGYCGCVLSEKERYEKKKSKDEKESL